jgi:hypothetical protein
MNKCPAHRTIPLECVIDIFSIRIVYRKANSRIRNTGRKAVLKYKKKKWRYISMSNQEYKEKIMEMVNQIEESSILRRIYLVLITITGAGR